MSSEANFQRIGGASGAGVEIRTRMVDRAARQQPRKRARFVIGRLDRYILSRTLPPMAAVLIGTTVAFLMERLLRSFYLLSQSSRGFDFIVQLAVDLLPHYVGLALPGGFFIALFVVVNRLNNASEIDAMLASGVSLGRIAAPLVALGVVLTVVSLLLYGFIQPYSRYAYRAVLHAADNAGWSGEVKPRAVFAPTPDLTLTADDTDATGHLLTGVFIRRIDTDGREEVLTARSAEIHRDADRRNATLNLKDGELLSTKASDPPRLLQFEEFTVRLPLAPTAKLLRSRGGGQETELTIVELFRQGFGWDPPVLPRQTLLAELYSRLARAFALPLMPLLAVPFGLTAKRAGSAPAIGVAGILLFLFQTSLILGQGVATQGNVSAAAIVGIPTALFATACVASFLASRRRPGENPVNWIAEHIDDIIAFVTRRRRDEDEASEARTV